MPGTKVGLSDESTTQISTSMHILLIPHILRIQRTYIITHRYDIFHREEPIWDEGDKAPCHFQNKRSKRFCITTRRNPDEGQAYYMHGEVLNLILLSPSTNTSLFISRQKIYCNVAQKPCVSRQGTSKKQNVVGLLNHATRQRLEEH